MKIPGKLPLKTILNKLPQLNSAQSKELNQIVGITASNKIVGLNTKEIIYRKSKKSFSVKLMNYVEPYLIKGQRYTLFYTEVDHNLKLGDRVFIESGNYDSDVIIQANKFNKLSDGYIVQYVDKTRVVLDIEYTGEYPWIADSDDDFIKVYVASTQEEFEYLIQQNSLRDSIDDWGTVFPYTFNKYQFLTNKFSKKNSHGTNTLLYLNGTFSLTGNDYGILGFTSSGTDYLTFSNSFLIYDGNIDGTQTPGYLKDITTDILSGSYSEYLSRNLHPRIGSPDFVSRNYIKADQRDISFAIVYTKVGIGVMSLFVDKPHNVTPGATVSINLSNLQGSGSLSYWEGTRTFTAVIGSQQSAYFFVSESEILPPGVSSAYITSGLATKLELSENDEAIYNNGSLKIFNSDFEKSGIKFKKDYTYSYENGTWVVDRRYLRPYITEQNFRNGVFKKGEFNQGLLGTHLEQILYNGPDVIFNLGSVINAKWIDGDIKKGVGNDLSYFTSFDEFGLPGIKINDKNNGGLGYNYIDDSLIQKSVIDNGTFNNNIIGSYSSDNVLEKYLINSPVNYFVRTNRGNYYNNLFVNSNINNSSIFSGIVSNSLIFNSKSNNSEFEKSVFYRSKFTSDKIIKIRGYEEKFLNWWDGPEWKQFKLYKFYINQEDLSRFVNFQSFYFDGLSINKYNSDVLNFFDDKFSLSSYYSSYDTNRTKRERRVIVQLSSKEDNTRTITGETNYIVDNTKYYGYASIDVMISATPSSNIEDFNTKKITEFYGDYKFNLAGLTTSIPSWDINVSDFEIETSGGVFTFSTVPNLENITNEIINLSIGTWTYSGYTLRGNGAYSYNRITVVDYTNDTSDTVYSYRDQRDIISESFAGLDVSKAYIIDSDFKSGLFTDSTWISGNYINYNKDHSIDINTESEYFNGLVDNNKVNINIGSRIRNKIFDNNDILFLNGVYYDTSSLGINSFIKLPDTYKISNILESTLRELQLDDLINGTSSVLYYLPSSLLAGSSTLLTRHAEIAYNYIHTVKFQNSTIKSGLFRRTYFQNCIFDNQLFNLNDKDPVNFNNWRSLILSDILFIDNSNTIKNGLVTNSSFVSGSDRWINGILYKSIWNVQPFTYSYAIGMTPSEILTTKLPKFENGIVKNSRWVNGIFGNGYFYKNKSNVPFNLSVYENSVPDYYRNRNILGSGFTKYAWLDGVFENGLFELSNFEKGTFLNGDFYNSTFLTGEAKAGNFGKRNLKFPLTRVASGTFSNVNVISAEFRSENPTGEVAGNFEINFYSGVFNSGQFGVKVDLGSYSENKFNYGFKSTWFNGTFNNGTFMDVASWQDGEFNNGKFTSYYGYPFVTAASYSSAGSSSFAWQDGTFNGGEFGNANIFTNSTWYSGSFNGGIFTGRYWNDGVLTKGYFLGSGGTATSLSKVPKFISDYSDNFYGLWNSGIVNESKEKFITKKRIFTKLEREFGKKAKKLEVDMRNILWRGGTFSHNNARMLQSVWLDGSFERGRFIESSFNPYANYLVNGYFQDTNDSSEVPFYEILKSDYVSGAPSFNNLNIQDMNRFNLDSAKKLIFSGTSSIVNLYQTTGLIIGDLYTVKMLVLENYNTEIRFGSSNKILRNRNFTEGSDYWTLGSTSSSGLNLPTLIIATGTPGYVEYTDGASGDTISFLIYQNALEVGKDYSLRFYTYNESNMVIPFVGSCDSSQVIIDSGVLLTDFIVNTNYTYSVPTAGSNIYISNFTAYYTDLVIELRASSAATTYRMTSFILSGNSNVLNTSDLSSRKMLSYSFIADGPDFSIEFIPKHTPSSIVPPVFSSATSSIFSVEVVKGLNGFNFSDSCYWYNGTFDNSEFYVSKWDNGRWLSGTATGMIWKNGVANYMNAYNVYWEGGVWRNGNWNGSPFSYENVNPNGCNYLYGNTASINFTSPWNNLDLTNTPGIPQGTGNYLVSYSGNSFIFSVTDGVLSGLYGSLTASYQDYGIDPSGVSNFVDNNGLPFVKTDAQFQFANNKRWRVTVNIGTVSVANLIDSDNVAFLFSIGKPSSESSAYGESSGTYEGSIYPDAVSLAGANFISNYYKLKSLDGHEGSVVPNLAIDGVDGYLSTKGGVVSEVLNSVSDSRLYFHINMYGVKEFYVDSVVIEEESCETRIEVNDGYVSDIITNIARYRKSIDDISFKEVFINNAFTQSIDLNFPNINGAPGITSSSFTSSSNTSWTYNSFYPYYDTTGCVSSTKGGGPGYGYLAYNDNGAIAGKGFLTSNTGNFKYTLNSSSPFIYAVNSVNSYNLFTQSGTFDVVINYMFQYGAYGSDPDAPTSGGTTDWPTEYTQSSKGNNQFLGVPTRVSFKVAGVDEQISGSITVRRLGCSSNRYFGTTGILTYTKTVEREFDDPLTFDLSAIQIRKIYTVPNITLFITGISVTNKTVQYDSTYNNATYSIFDDTPTYSDTLILPPIEAIGGYSEGNLISTRFGNGIFTSGTASSYSSIWENGVWNEGIRFDKNVYAFSGLGYFSKTEKPFAFAGNLDIKKVKIGNNASDLDKNMTKMKPSGRTWVVVLRRAIGFVEYEGFSINQYDRKIDEFFKVGDKVIVGNVVSTDLNGKRRLIRDPFTVVQILGDLIYLQVTLNFPIRKVDKDSDEHLIYVSKNIWLNGAFLNGLFKGIWSNGLFKGRPYITRMVDSQWIDGRFEGGRFRGLTMAVWDNNAPNPDSEVEVYPSALIQNFTFKDEDKFNYGNNHKYNSWIDVNYTTASTVTVFRDTVTYDEGGFISGSISYGELARTNHFSLPTFDVLNSESFIRENNSSNVSKYNLGIKYEEYENFLEDVGNFDNYYSTKNEFGIRKFISDGFTYSEQGFRKKDKNGPTDPSNQTTGTFSYLSNVDDGNENILEIRTINATGDEMNDELGWNVGGGNFNVLGILNNTKSDGLVKKRYSYISYDLILNHTPGDPWSLDMLPSTLTGSSYRVKPWDYLGFTYSEPLGDVLNFVNLQLTVDKGNSVLPIGFLNTLNRPTLNVKEYFYNKRSLNLITSYFILGPTPSSIKLYNFKMVETDAIPFFLLGTQSRINNAIQAPLGSSAPFIDYSNSEFSLIDSIVVTETIFETLSNPVTVVTGNGLQAPKGASTTKGGAFWASQEAITAIKGGKAGATTTSTAKASTQTFTSASKASSGSSGFSSKASPKGG